MTVEEIRTKIAAGRKKAEQRRGVSDRLGVRRTKKVTRVVEEVVETSRPKSEEEIEASIKAGHQAAANRRKAIIAARARAKEAARKIREKGFTLNYKAFPGEMVSFAYRYDEKTKKGEIYFAVRSDKDEFSRPAARMAILKHMEENTHHAHFVAPSSKMTDLTFPIMEAVTDRLKTHPQEFPSFVVKKFQVFSKVNEEIKRLTSDPEFLSALRERLGMTVPKEQLN